MVDKKPLTEYSFSFIVPVYNVERKLFEGCLNSIVSLNFADYELIIVNDGSTLPEVEEICQDFAAKYGNVKYFVQENQGSAVARNTGLEHASGEYVMFVDADDRLDENLHEEFSRLDGDFDILCMGYEVDYPDGRKVLIMSNYAVDFSDKKDELYKGILGVPNVLKGFPMGSVVFKCFRMQFIHENNIRFQPQLRKTQDFAFMLEAFYAAKKILYRPILCYHNYINSQSICHKMNFNMFEYCFKAYLALDKWSEEHSIDLASRKYINQIFFNNAISLTYLHKDYKEGFISTAKGILEQYDRFNVGEAVKNITFRELIPFRGSGLRVKMFIAKVFGKYVYALSLIAYYRLLKR